MYTLVFGANSSVGKELKQTYPAKYLDSYDCNLLDINKVRATIQEYKPDKVIMLAAKVGGIFDNISHQFDYLTQNVLMNSNVIKVCQENHVERLLCISSTCAYPDISDPYKYPLKERQMHDGAPTKTNFGYGYAKRLMQAQIETCNEQYGTNYSYFIPCNLYGPYSKYGDDSHFLGKLLRKIWLYQNFKLDRIEMAGGSSAMRQYLYTPDLVKCIRYWSCTDDTIMANVAPPENNSIKKITEIALAACKCSAEVTFLNEGMSGQQRKDVSSELLLSRYSDMSFTPLWQGISETYSKVCEQWR